MFAYRRPPGKALSRSRPLLETPIPTYVRKVAGWASANQRARPMKRLLLALLPLAMAAIVLATVLTIPAAAQKQRVTVRLADGTFQQWVVEAPDGATLQDIRTLIPQGEPVAMEPVPEATTPTVPPTSPQPPQPAPEPKVEKPNA